LVLYSNQKYLCRYYKMANFFDMFFGPLDEKWCNIFLVSTVLYFVSLVSVIFAVIMTVLTGFGKIQIRDIISMFFALFGAGLFYIVARLEYRICTAAL